MGKSKIFLKPLWIILSVIFVSIFAAMVIGTFIADTYRASINAFFETQDFKLVQTEEAGDTDYYPSPYLDANGNYNDDALNLASMEIARQIANEGSALLRNKNNALPLSAGASVSLFGTNSVNYVYSGFGSGKVIFKKDNPPATLAQGLTAAGLNVNGTLTNFYQKGAARSYIRGDQKIKEAPWSVYTDAVKKSFSSYGDAAVFVLSRIDGESMDLDQSEYAACGGIDNNYLNLSPEERDVLIELTKLKKDGTFDSLVVLINSGCAVQMDELLGNPAIDADAILFAGMGGSAAASSVADILLGNANPSGRLTDTYVYDNYSAPATENSGNHRFANAGSAAYKKLQDLMVGQQFEKNDRYYVYQEGIYVGYRYYETRYEDTVLGRGNAKGGAGIKNGGGSEWNYTSEVAYPFGYGLSYTTFTYGDFDVVKAGKDYNLSVKVTNTGSRPGKEVVQFYVQKPYTEYDRANGIEKAAVELCGFAKTTDVIAPGASVTLKATVEGDAFKTYDANGHKTYIVEKSDDYYLAAGKNAHDALNNILAAKGKTTADGMDYNGDAALAEKLTLAEDLTTYSVSETTEKKIGNRFDGADINRYEGNGGQKATYLSRNDWNGTYPAPYNDFALTGQMYEEILYEPGSGGVVVANSADEMPTFGKSGELSVITLKGLDYNHTLWNELLDQVSFKEAAELCIKGSMSMQRVLSVNLPAARACDGPAGMTRFFAGDNTTGTGMCYPGEAIIAGTFDPALIEKLGEVFAYDMIHAGYTCIYGPGANIHRTAYSGRNWEYYSEDGYISGIMLAAECKGLTEHGAVVVAKHFALNDNEQNRNGGLVWANEQSIREIYLKVFEAGVTSETVNGLMSSFNRIGTEWAGSHKGLLTGVLRDEWGFNGFVETDAECSPYMAMYAEGLVAGNDVWMGNSGYDQIKHCENNATVAKALRESTHRILYTLVNSNVMNGVDQNTKVVPIMTWWQITLVVIDVVLGVIAAGCVTMAVLSFVFKRKNGDEEKTEN